MAAAGDRMVDSLLKDTQSPLRQQTSGAPYLRVCYTVYGTVEFEWQVTQ